MAASSDLQALQLQNRNLQQKLDWKQLKINQRDKHIRDLRDATPARAADLERLERSLCRLSLQMGPKSLRCSCAKGVGHRAQLMLRARRGDS